MQGELGQLDDELDGYDDVVRRFGSSESIPILSIVAHTLFGKAVKLGIMKRWRESIDVCDQVVRRFEGTASSELLDIVVRTLLLKISVLGVLGRTEDQRSTFDQVLSRILPRLNSISKWTLESLIACQALETWKSTRSAVLIRKSPSADRLLALTTAFELEMGMQPRVAVEVQEVARDILSDLARLREDR